jgi:hypothetical protein
MLGRGAGCIAEECVLGTANEGTARVGGLSLSRPEVQQPRRRAEPLRVRVAAAARPRPCEHRADDHDVTPTRPVRFAAALGATLALTLSAAALLAEGAAWRAERGEVRVVCPLTVGGSFEARTSSLSGTLALVASQPLALAGALAVDLRTLDTGIDLRSEHMRDSYLEVGRGEGFDSAVLSEIRLRTAAGERVSMQEIFKKDAPEKVRALYQKHAMGNSLLRNGGGTFRDTTSAAGVGMGRWSWASDAWDFDHDGFPDLYVTNGMVSGPSREDSNDDLNSFFWRQVVANSPDGAKRAHEWPPAPAPRPAQSLKQRGPVAIGIRGAAPATH